MLCTGVSIPLSSVAQRNFQIVFGGKIRAKKGFRVCHCFELNVAAF